MNHPARERLTRSRPAAVAGEADRGSVTIEVAILAPALLMLLGLAIVGGRYELAAGTIEAAASAGARAASLARTAADAQRDARRLVEASLHDQDLHCRNTTVSVDTSGFATRQVLRPAETPVPAHVTVTLTCQLDTALLSLPGLPGSTTIRATASSVLDTYRANSSATTLTETP
ncbi:MAG: hypothetical protein QG597_4159 [Actinomycetota bacterium]|nr:hypothetical protein [Actinomycetota bacterium]